MKIARDPVLILVLCLLVLGSGVDLYNDLAQGASFAHFAREAVVAIIALALIVWIWLEQRRQAVELQRMRQELASRQDYEHMSEDVQRIRRQLSEVVSKQFAEWKLTDSEQAVGWLLLKGLSLKEIAIIRETLEKTVRQQASSIYRKSGLAGRHAFSAWFIEDLL